MEKMRITFKNNNQLATARVLFYKSLNLRQVKLKVFHNSKVLYICNERILISARNAVFGSAVRFLSLFLQNPLIEAGLKYYK